MDHGNKIEVILNALEMIRIQKAGQYFRNFCESLLGGYKHFLVEDFKMLF